MLESLIDFLARGEGPLAYLVLAGCAAIEYLVPPFPGDAAALFGSYLAVTAGYHGVFVYVTLVIGSLSGAMLTYAIGRALPTEPERRPRWLRSPRIERALAEVTARFDRYGPAYLTINRFVPVVRAVAFIGAGIARLPAGRVVFFGGISACLHTGVIFALASVAPSFEVLQANMRLVTIGAVVLVVVFVVVWWWRRRVPVLPPPP